MSGGILKDKVDKIIVVIEGENTYINNVLVLRKDKFTKYIEQLRFIIDRLVNYGLKFNT